MYIPSRGESYSLSQYFQFYLTKDYCYLSLNLISEMTDHNELCYRGESSFFLVRMFTKISIRASKAIHFTILVGDL